MERKHVVVYTAGICEQDPGPGGWSCVLLFGEHRKEMNGSLPDTTRMGIALFAAISALGALKMGCEVELYTPSPAVVKAFETNAFERWKRAMWRQPDGRDIPNRDLWFILSTQARKHELHVRLLQNAPSQEDRTRCDELAKEALGDWRTINSPHDEDGELMADP